LRCVEAPWPIINAFWPTTWVGYQLQSSVPQQNIWATQTMSLQITPLSLMVNKTN
jgi:hypothetical protein